MTPYVFGVHAPITRSSASSADHSRRAAVRIAWLIASFMRRESVRYDKYAERFERSQRSFYRDLATLRDAGLYLDDDLRGEYRMLCFRSEREAA
jgi:predicted DNA-binding transcriptional regulator YafY